MAKRIYTEEEARERKNARQREYAKRTGYAANNRYNKMTYSQIVVKERKEVAEMYKKKCDELGISYSEILHEAIKRFLEND
jgi:hypothetical protein